MGRDRGKRKSLSAVDKLFDSYFMSIVFFTNRTQKKKSEYISISMYSLMGLLFIHFINFAFNSRLRLIRFAFSLNVPLSTMSVGATQSNLI